MKGSYNSRTARKGSFLRKEVVVVVGLPLLEAAERHVLEVMTMSSETPCRPTDYGFSDVVRTSPPRARFLVAVRKVYAVISFPRPCQWLLSKTGVGREWGGTISE